MRIPTYEEWLEVNEYSIQKKFDDWYDTCPVYTEHHCRPDIDWVKEYESAVSDYHDHIYQQEKDLI